MLIYALLLLLAAVAVALWYRAEKRDEEGFYRILSQRDWVVSRRLREVEATMAARGWQPVDPAAESIATPDQPKRILVSITPAPRAERVHLLIDRRRIAQFLAALFLATTAFAQDAPSPPEPTRDAEVSMLAGGTAVMGAADTGLLPFARVAVSVPLAESLSAPELLVQADLTGSQGQDVDLGDATTFRAIEFSLGVSQRLSSRLNFALYAEAGFATRLPTQPEPLQRAVRWGGLGVRVGGYREPGYLALTIGADQRLSGHYRPAVTVAGSIRLWEVKGGPVEGASLRLIGRGVLGLDLRRAATSIQESPPADQIVVGLAVGK